MAAKKKVSNFKGKRAAPFAKGGGRDRKFPKNYKGQPRKK